MVAIAGWEIGIAVGTNDEYKNLVTGRTRTTDLGQRQVPPLSGRSMPIFQHPVFLDQPVLREADRDPRSIKVIQDAIRRSCEHPKAS